MGRRRRAQKKPVTAVTPLGEALDKIAPSPRIGKAPADTPSDAPAANAGKKRRRSKGQRKEVHSRLIATFHALNKTLARAREQGDDDAATEAEAALSALGGLERYQRASVRGEELRGTNTARWLVKKLGELGLRPPPGSRRLALLDVGALGLNYSKVGWVDADAIDLNAQAPGIAQCDFFDFEPPARRLGDGATGDGRPYDVVSLSLVVNFVPDVNARGEMLRKSCALVRPGGHVFLVLPRACVDNSRFTTDESLRAQFDALGLGVALHHLSSKLAFYLLRLDEPHRHKHPDPAPFKRRLLMPGASRNNFVIGIGSR